MEVRKLLMSKQKIDSAYNGESNENSREDNDDSENMLSEDEDEQEEKEDLAFFGDDAEDSDNSKKFNNDSDLLTRKQFDWTVTNQLTKKRINIDIPFIFLTASLTTGQNILQK
jgi:hypothetical protein